MKNGAAPCQLCGLPLPANPPRLDRAGKAWHFCCDSCKQIFQMLQADPATVTTTNPRKESGHG